MLHPVPQQIKLPPAFEIRDWEQFLQDGEAFLKTATGAFSRKKRAFTPEILYNIIAMAIEKFVMAALMRAGVMPCNHTMADLVEAMEKTFPGALTNIRKNLLALDKYQEICDVDNFRMTSPGLDEIPAMLELAERLHFLVTNDLMESSWRSGNRA